jgi:Bacterial Ig-like domain
MLTFRPIPRAIVSVRHLVIPALLAALLAQTGVAGAQPLDPATVFGVPQLAPGCPDPLLDCDPPTDSTTLPAIPASGWFTTPTVNATLSGGDAGSGLAGIEYAADGGDVTTGTDNEIVSFNGDGSHTLAHRAVDNAGNASGWVLDSFGIDATQPVNTTAPVDPLTQASATITVTGSDPSPGSGLAVVKWQVDGGAVGSGPSGTQVAITADGAHTIATWAVDVAGNASDPRVDTVNIDATLPVDTSSVPAAWLTGSPALITLTGTDGGGPATAMEYQLDGGGTQSVVNGGTVAVGGDGFHSLKHRAVDAVGNRSAWITDAVNVDTTAPVNTSAASATWADPAQHVTVSGNDATSGVDHVEWQVDGGPVLTGASGTDVTVTGDGVHPVRTRVVDVAGNASSWRTDNVKVDTAAPVDLTSAPAGWQSAPLAVDVNGYDAGSGVASVEWSLDNGPTTTVPAASTTVTVTGDGQHTLRTRVTDALGHRTGWKSLTVRIDTTAPSNTTAVPPAGWQNGTVAVELDGADGGSGLDSMEWRVDGAPAQSGPAGTVVAITGDGAHTLQTRAVDSAGNASGWRSDSIQIDTVAPSDVTSLPGTVAYGVTATIAGTDTASGVSRAEWKLGGVAGAGANGSQVPLGGPGTHTLEHRVLDAAGNASPWTTSTVTVDPALNGDVTAPVDTTTVPSGWQTSSPVTVHITGTDADTAVDHVEWRADGGPRRSGPSGSALDISGEGVHHFDTRVFDLAGNSTGWTDHVVRVDSVSPVDATSVAAWQNTQTVTLAASDATSGVSRMEWWVDGGATQTGPAGTAVTFPADGTYTLEHRAVDAAENASARVSDTVRIDTVVPVDTTPAAPAGWQTSAWSVTPTGTDADSGVAAVQARVDGVPVTGTPVVIGTDGPHTLETRVLDRAGNATAWRTQTVKIDRHAPADTTPAVPAGWRTTAWTTTPSADDGAGSGVVRVEWRLGSAGAISTAAPATVSAEGTTELQTRAVDAVGHASAWRSQTVRIDHTAPVAGVACVPAAAPTGYACTASGTDAGSGVTALRWRVGGGGWQPPAAGGTFAVASGTVEVQATDGVGLTGTATSTALVARIAPRATTPTPGSKPAGTVRTRSVAVKRRGTRGSRGLLGAFELRSVRVRHEPADASADVRPLSLGKGRFRVTIRLFSGQLTAQRVRVMRFSAGGWSPRMGVALTGVTKAMHATLTVEQRRGTRWRRIAVSDATLKP